MSWQNSNLFFNTLKARTSFLIAFLWSEGPI
uniref:Uncharacterized protein n=1 Tax=Anguilla anguilla TaxID=7936 RepID=A0A0E9RA92_ANGAN